MSCNAGAAFAAIMLMNATVSLLSDDRKKPIAAPDVNSSDGEGMHISFNRNRYRRVQVEPGKFVIEEGTP